MELKGAIFKKFDKNNLFQVSCSDVRERFHLFALLFVVVVQTMKEYGWKEGKCTCPNTHTQGHTIYVIPISARGDPLVSASRFSPSVLSLLAGSPREFLNSRMKQGVKDLTGLLLPLPLPSLWKEIKAVWMDSFGSAATLAEKTTTITVELHS